MSYAIVLQRAHELALRYLTSLPNRPVESAEPDGVTGLPSQLPPEASDPVEILNALAHAVDVAGVRSAGPRYFGFVTGGSLPAAVAADWLVSAFDQNAGLHVLSPAIAQIEDAVASWLLDLFALPSHASVGFVTGATMANVTALAAARDEVLRRVGWDVEEDGLQGAPSITVVAGESAHASIDSACRLVGFGTRRVIRVAADDQGRIRPDALERTCAGLNGPAIVCLQAGHVNTGAFDPFHASIAAARACGAWVHVDGAFGLWARAVDRLRPLTDGWEAADSWTVDAHKWLNVPYDSGIVIVAHPAPHRAAMAQTASYLIRATGERRDGMDWTPEASRRARVVPIYAALLALGRSGVAEMVNRCCALAALMARRLSADAGVRLLNDVVLNQVLVRFEDAEHNVTRDVIARVQRDGVCWVGGTLWQGEPAMRISIANWSTTEDDIERSARSILVAWKGDTHTSSKRDTSDKP